MRSFWLFLLAVMDGCDVSDVGEEERVRDNRIRLFSS